MMKKLAFSAVFGLLTFGAVVQAQPATAPHFLQSLGVTPIFSPKERAAFQNAMLSMTSLEPWQSIWSAHQAARIARFASLGLNPVSMPAQAFHTPLAGGRGMGPGGHGPRR